MEIRSTELFAHENYNSNRLSDDIALIKLPSPVQLSGMQTNSNMYYVL